MYICWRWVQIHKRARIHRILSLGLLNHWFELLFNDLKIKPSKLFHSYTETVSVVNINMRELNEQDVVSRCGRYLNKSCLSETQHEALFVILNI